MEKCKKNSLYGITAGRKCNFSDYESALLLGILEDYISEYGSKDWPIRMKPALLNILTELGGSDELLEYIGGIL